MTTTTTTTTTTNNNTRLGKVSLFLYTIRLLLWLKLRAVVVVVAVAASEGSMPLLVYHLHIIYNIAQSAPLKVQPRNQPTKLNRATLKNFGTTTTTTTISQLPFTTNTHLV